MVVEDIRAECYDYGVELGYQEKVMQCIKKQKYCDKICRDCDIHKEMSRDYKQVQENFKITIR